MDDSDVPRWLEMRAALQSLEHASSANASGSPVPMRSRRLSQPEERQLLDKLSHLRHELVDDFSSPLRRSSRPSTVGSSTVMSGFTGLFAATSGSLHKTECEDALPGGTAVLGQSAELQGTSCPITSVIKRRSMLDASAGAIQSANLLRRCDSTRPLQPGSCLNFRSPRGHTRPSIARIAAQHGFVCARPEYWRNDRAGREKGRRQGIRHRRPWIRRARARGDRGDVIQCETRSNSV